MTFKLACRNLKKSISNYTVYFVTLIIGVSIFYVFNAIQDQTVTKEIFSRDISIITLLKQVISAASVIVSGALAFLVVYASNFLMKRRKKEFGIYLLLGMSKRMIAGIIITETILIGLLSLVVGLGVGVVLSQGMSVLTASIFEVDMSQFEFEVSVGGMGRTIVYFLIMYGLVIILDLFVVGKSRLITLLTAERRTEKNIARNPWLCVIVFIASAAVLISAYYMVTVTPEKIAETSDLLREIGKGIVTTFFIFWSASGLFLFVAQCRKKHYMKGLNAFTTKEVGGRINTNVFAGSVICLMLFITICVLSSALSIYKSMNDNVKKMVPADVVFEKQMVVSSTPDSEEPEKRIRDTEKNRETISDVFTRQGIDSKMFRESVEVPSYNLIQGDEDYALTVKETLGEAYAEMVAEDGGEEALFWRFTWENVMRVSDYNRLAQIYHMPEYSLGEDEYMIVANYKTMVDLRNMGLAKKTPITIGNRQYHPKYTTCQDGFLYMAAQEIEMGTILVPDDTDLSQCQPAFCYYVANYNESYPGGKEAVEKILMAEKRHEKLSDSEIHYRTRVELHNNSISLSALVTFLGMYLGIVFILASSAVLALKELSQAADNRRKYEILRKIGVDERMINRSLLKQSALFFGMPLVLAVIHSVFGIQVCVYIVETFGITGLRYAIIGTAIILLGIYIIYFFLTYRGVRRILKE